LLDKRIPTVIENEKIKFLTGILPIKELNKIETNTRTRYQYNKDASIWSVFIMRVMIFKIKYPDETPVPILRILGIEQPILGIEHWWAAY
jgi:hypothetical protein